VASGVCIIRTVAFDEGIVIIIRVKEITGFIILIYRKSTAWVTGCVPLLRIGRNIPFPKD
jgi:hypothetical protein